jgi:predicted nucleic acid-binding Zn ribbon protein
MSRRAPRPFSIALGAFADGLAPATTLARVQRVWERAAGAAIARFCQPTAERSGVLTVTCAEAVWAHELQLMSAEVVERLNGELGGEAISQIRCRTG